MVAALCLIFTVGILYPSLIFGKATFSDCGGKNKKLTLTNGAVDPDPIKYPGNFSMTADIQVLDDLPASGFKMNLNLTKLDPRVMHVPCLQDIGSCEYDVCELIQNHKDEFCPMFPPHIKCGCPIKKSTYNLRNAVVAIPDFGEIFAKILQGRYEGTITFTDTNAGTEVGCIAITFKIDPSI